MKWIFASLIFLIGLSANGQTTKDSITVYYFMSEECKICQYYSNLQIDLYENYNDSYTSFVGLFPNHFSSVPAIDSYKKKYQIPFTLKKEFFQTKTKKFDAKITPEVVVYNETKEEVIYQGRIDNSYASLGKLRRVVTQHELKDVLESLKQGSVVTTEYVAPIGCYISLK